LPCPLSSSMFATHAETLDRVGEALPRWIRRDKKVSVFGLKNGGLTYFELFPRR
jgi:hypothetical protein